MKKIIDRLLEFILVTLMMLLVLDVTWQVFARYILENPSSYTDELARFLLIWVSLLGAAYAHGQKKHLAIDIFPQSLNPYNQKRLDQLIQILVIGFSLCVMCIGGGRLVFITLYLKQFSSALQLPLGFIYMVIPLSGSLIVFYGIYHLMYYETKKL